MGRGMSIREAAAKFNKSRNTVRKMQRSGVTSFVYQRKEQQHPARGVHLELLVTLVDANA